MNEQHQGERVEGRSIIVNAWGADMPSLEMAALDEAREFFGPEVRLEVAHDYHVYAYTNAKEGRYNANVHIREALS